MVEILKESNKLDDIKPTSGIDFSYIKKSYNSSEIISLYEIAGARTLKHMIPSFITS